MIIVQLSPKEMIITKDKNLKKKKVLKISFLHRVEVLVFFKITHNENFY